jgi:hypothetical protein
MMMRTRSGADQVRGFTKNRERLIGHDAVIELFNEGLAIANKNHWLLGEHSSVDYTLIQAWARQAGQVRR